MFASFSGVMKSQKSLPRRRFLQISAAAAVSGNALLSCSRPERLWRSLTSEEALLVGVISDQVIPQDQDPGGKESGVVNFIDLQLAGPHKRFRKVYQEGLAKLNKTSILLFQRAFVDLPFATQTDLLAKLEAEALPSLSGRTNPPQNSST